MLTEAMDPALAAPLGCSVTTGDTATQLRDATGGGPRVAVDTTARPDVIATALTVLRARGTLALVGLGALTSELPVGLFLAKGLDMRSVVEGDSAPHAFIPRLAGLWRSEELPLDRLVTRFDVDAFGDAWTAAKTGRAVKPVVVFGR